MKSEICTLFEGHFHKGVATLINSLYKNDFRGDFYAGYRGPLPKWADKAKDNSTIDWPGTKTLQFGKDLMIHFLPVSTDYHLAHYKPDFMQRLFAGPAANTEALAYFDPDIVVLCTWRFFEKWMRHGVSMVHEVVSNDMPTTHPKRMDWCDIIKKIRREPQRDILSYINSGFCGVSRNNIEFLDVWSKIIELAIKEYKMDPKNFFVYDRTSTFYCIDQDSFNIAAMCCKSPISEMGPEAMDFIGAGWTMSHAAGWPKPWKNNFIRSALIGIPPSKPHKHHWENVKEPINLYGNIYTIFMKFQISIATLIGRFYMRN